MIFLHLIPPSWWMRLFQRLVKPSWRAGLGLDSLMGRAVCKGVSRGGCGLRMSLGSLSSDGWGCAACLLSHFSCVQLFATPARLLCPWASPGKDTGVGCHFLLQGISCIGKEIFTTEPPGKPTLPVRKEPKQSKSRLCLSPDEV